MFRSKLMCAGKKISGNENYDENVRLRIFSDLIVGSSRICPRHVPPLRCFAGREWLENWQILLGHTHHTLWESHFGPH